jgi:hypothetical protein
MADDINLQVQDGYVLLTATKNHQAELAEYGVTAEEVQSLETAIGNLESKDAAHEEARNTETDKTKAQDAQIVLALKQIKKIQDLAKGAFGRTSPVLKQFHVGVKQSKSVSSVLNELVYFKEVATRYQGDLVARGFKDADLTALDTLHTALAAADSDQENAKRLQTAAMSERTAAAQELKMLAYRIRKSADVCFADNPAVLSEFKSIIQHSRSAKKSDTITAGDTTTGNG